MKGRWPRHTDQIEAAIHLPLKNEAPSHPSSWASNRFNGAAQSNPTTPKLFSDLLAPLTSISKELGGST